MTVPFTLALKSTLDKVVYELAVANSLQYVDLDGAAINSAKLLEAQNAIAWAVTGYAPERGNNPFFDLAFEVAAVTSSDPAAFTSFDITGFLLDAFPPLSTFQVYDYSGEHAGTDRRGSFTIIEASVQPLMTNDVQGLRAISITAKGSRI